MAIATATADRIVSPKRSRHGRGNMTCRTSMSRSTSRTCAIEYEDAERRRSLGGSRGHDRALPRRPRAAAPDPGFSISHQRRQRCDGRSDRSARGRGGPVILCRNLRSTGTSIIDNRAHRSRQRLRLHRAPGALLGRGPDPQRRLRRTAVLHVRRHHPRAEDDTTSSGGSSNMDMRGRSRRARSIAAGSFTSTISRSTSPSDRPTTATGSPWRWAGWSSD